MGALLNRDAAAADTLKGVDLRDVRWGSDAYHAVHKCSEKIGMKHGKFRKSFAFPRGS